MSAPRYAVYFVPEDDSALARFGWDWLGRGPDAAAPPPPSRQAEITAEARRYGFHATLKPPFRLGEGASLPALCAALRDFAAGRRPFAEPPLALAELDGFLALRPSRHSAAIADLADDCVRVFDTFRAPAGAEERLRRLARPLTPRQRRQVEAWGYPYVFEDFRFHLTLTGRLDDDERARWLAALHELAGPALAEPVAFRSLCLFEQNAAAAPFTLLDRFPFGG